MRLISIVPHNMKNSQVEDITLISLTSWCQSKNTENRENGKNIFENTVLLIMYLTSLKSKSFRPKMGSDGAVQYSIE